MDTRRRPPVHATLLLVGAALCVAFALTEGAARAAVLTASSAIPAAVVVALLVRGRVRRTSPWWLLAAGLVALTVNSLTWFVDANGSGEPTTGALPQISLLVGYACLLVASLGILAPLARHDAGALLETTALWLGGASLLWLVVVEPALARHDADTGTRLYTLLVLLVLSAVAGQVLRAAMSNAPARPALAYLTVAIALTLAGNVLAEATRAADGRDAAWWIGLVWIAAFSALAAAAAHPSRGALTDLPTPAPVRLSTGRLLLFGLALALNPLLAGVQGALGREVDWMLLTVASLAIVTLVVARIADLTRRQAAAERSLAHLATHDELTGLANRRAALEHLEQALGRVGSGVSDGLTLLFLDVDGLKAINDQYGHPAGDDVIRTVSRRLVGSIPAGAFAARFGGDEFVVIDESPPTDGGGEVDRIRAALTGCHTIAGRPLPTGASIGVRQVPAGTVVTVSQVVAEADERMYADKRRHPTET